MNQGGLLFLRQAKGIQLNLSQDNARFSKSFIGVNRTGTQAAKSITRGSTIRSWHLKANPNNTVELSGATSMLAAFGKDARPYFLDMLDTPDRFGAAHVALTELTEPPSRFSGKLDLSNSGNYEYNRMS